MTQRNVLIGAASLVTAATVIVTGVFTVLDSRYYLADAGGALQRSVDQSSVDILYVQRILYDRERDELMRKTRRTDYENARLRRLNDVINTLDRRIETAEKKLK